MRKRTGLWARLSTLAVAGIVAAALFSPAESAEAAPSSAGTITIGGKCLDDSNYNTENGAKVQVYDCNGSTAQNWTWEDDGTVRIFGKCLDVSGASNATGALVQLYDCTAGAANQKFSALPEGTIYSADSAKCLAVQGAVAAGSRVALEPCNPAKPKQLWEAATATGPEYTLSAEPAQQNTYGSDTPTLPYIDDDGTFYAQNGVAAYGADAERAWTFYTGDNFDSMEPAEINSAVDPDNPVDSNDDTTWRCNNSPTGKKSTAAPEGSSYSQRNYCDLTGVWVDPDTGNWYGLVHNEFTPQPFGDGMHFDSVDYAVSTDKGATWDIKAQVITSPFSTNRDDTTQFPGDIYYYGGADPRLFVDNASGYFYMFYASRTIAKPGAEAGQSWLQHVARAPISQKMAPDSWQKWYDGAWQEPGIGGKESNIIPADGNGPGYTAPEDDYDPTELGSQPEQVKSGVLPDDSQLTVMNVAWSAYLGKYIGTPQNNVAQDTGTKTPQHFYATDDLATQKWEDMGTVDSNKNGSWYRWLLDAGNLTSSTILGKTFRQYCTFECSTYWNEYTETTIEPTSPSALPEAPVKADTGYAITNADGNVLAQVGAEVGVTAEGTGADTEKWQFTDTGDGFFTITNAASGKALSAYSSDDSSRAWGAGLSVKNVAESGDAKIAQQWSFQRIGSTDEYRLVNRFSNLALSLSPEAKKQAAFAPIRQWDPPADATGDTRSAAAQKLTFTPANAG